MRVHATACDHLKKKRCRQCLISKRLAIFLVAAHRVPSLKVSKVFEKLLVLSLPFLFRATGCDNQMVNCDRNCSSLAMLGLKL